MSSFRIKSRFTLKLRLPFELQLPHRVLWLRIAILLYSNPYSSANSSTLHTMQRRAVFRICCSFFVSGRVVLRVRGCSYQKILQMLLMSRAVVFIDKPFRQYYSTRYWIFFQALSVTLMRRMNMIVSGMRPHDPYPSIFHFPEDIIIGLMMFNLTYEALMEEKRAIEAQYRPRRYFYIQIPRPTREDEAWQMTVGIASRFQVVDRRRFTGTTDN